jgi:hypothetical protein
MNTIVNKQMRKALSHVMVKLPLLLVMPLLLLLVQTLLLLGVFRLLSQIHNRSSTMPAHSRCACSISWQSTLFVVLVPLLMPVLLTLFRGQPTSAHL